MLEHRDLVLQWENCAGELRDLDEDFDPYIKSSITNPDDLYKQTTDSNTH